jgi:hypothetical protein
MNTQSPPSTIPPGRALEDAYACFLLAASGLRPRALNVLNSPAALRNRACEIDALILSFQGLMTTLLEDTAQHFALSRRLDDIAVDCLSDMASELRAYLVESIQDTAS